MFLGFVVYVLCLQCFVVLYFMKWGVYDLNFLPFVDIVEILGFILFCFAMFSSSTIFGQFPSFLEKLSAA
jgi:hypothetical protein